MAKNLADKVKVFRSSLSDDERAEFDVLCGRPWRIAYFDRDADPADIAACKRILDGMSKGEPTTEVIPASANFETIHPWDDVPEDQQEARHGEAPYIARPPYMKNDG